MTDQEESPTTIEFSQEGVQAFTIAAPPPPTLTIQGTDQKTMVKIWLDTGKVEIEGEPEEEVCKEAAQIFWRAIEEYGSSLRNRVETTHDLLKELRDALPGDNVMSGLRAMSSEQRDDVLRRIDNFLRENETFLEQAKVREGTRESDGGQSSN